MLPVSCWLQRRGDPLALSLAGTFAIQPVLREALRSAPDDLLPLAHDPPAAVAAPGVCLPAQVWEAVSARAPGSEELVKKHSSVDPNLIVPP